jgi:hypothetical protein
MFSPFGKSKIPSWRFLGLLDETMQHNQTLITDVEYDAGDAVGKPSADLPKAVPEGIDQGLSDRPVKLNSFQIGTDQSAFHHRQALQPLANRLIACRRSVEGARKRMTRRYREKVVSFLRQDQAAKSGRLLTGDNSNTVAHPAVAGPAPA